MGNDDAKQDLSADLQKAEKLVDVMFTKMTKPAAKGVYFILVQALSYCGCCGDPKEVASMVRGPQKVENQQDLDGVRAMMVDLGYDDPIRESIDKYFPQFVQQDDIVVFAIVSMKGHTWNLALTNVADSNE